MTKSSFTNSLLLLAAALAASPAPAQTTPPTATAKPVAFDVVSIHPSKPGSPMMGFGISPDGFRASGMPLSTTILIAYIPQGMAFWSKDSLSGAPAWVNKDLYDIDAKVAPEDVAAWQKLSQNLTHKDMVDAMLQAMLAERCKLAVHLVPAEATGYALVLGKRPLKLQPTPADEVEPTGVRLADGGVMVFTGKDRHDIEWTFHNASMASLSNELSMWMNSSDGPRPVVDRTGLTGRYDFPLRKRDESSPSPADDTQSAADPSLEKPWDVESLGLALTPTKVPTQTIVIDHIEPPSEN
jgi:uncharacterized protein (TIGR03435 family)